MKTKFLLTAAALSVAFVACTDEVLVEQNANATLKDRAMVDAPSINPSLGTDSRLHLEGASFVFDNGDELGACLMDEIITPYYGDKDYAWSRWFKLVDYIQTNYKFSYNGEAFENDALMSEGNYFFYYPYDVTMVTRDAFKTTLASDQTFTVGSPRQTVLDNQVFLGHTAITRDKEGDVENVNLTMKAVHAYPAFRLTYSDEKPLVVKKVVLKKAAVTDDGKEGEAGLFNMTLQVDPTGMPFKSNYNWDANQYVLNTATKDYHKMVDDVAVEQIAVSIPDVTITSNSDKLAGYIVIPAGVYDNKNDRQALWMHIYTDKGVVKTYLHKKNEEQDPAGTPSDNVWTKAAYTNFQPNNGMLIDMGFSFDAVSTPDKFTISTTEDFELFMGWQKEQSVPVTLEATIVGKDVVLTKNVVDILNANSNLTLNIKANADAELAIAENAPKNAYDRVNLKSENIKVVNYATLTIAKNYKKSGKVPSVLVNKGDITFTYNSANGAALANNELGNITNEGTVTFKGESKLNNAPYYRMNVVGANIVNKFGATINVERNTTISEATENYGTVNVAAGATLESAINNNNQGYYKVAEINVNGTWKATGNNNADVNVAVGGKLDGKLVNIYNKLWNNDSSAYHETAINNAGIVKDVQNGVAKKGGLINITSENAELLDHTAYSGEVNNTVGSGVVYKVENEKIFASMSGDLKVSEVAAVVTKSNAAEMRLSGTLTADYKNEFSKTVMNTIDEKYLEDWSYIIGEDKDLEVVAVGNLLIKGQVAIKENRTAKQNGDFTVNAGTTTTVARNAYLSLQSGVLTVNGTLTIVGGGEVKAWANAASVNNIKQSGTFVNTNTTNSETAPGEGTSGQVTLVASAAELQNAIDNANADLTIKFKNDISSEEAIVIVQEANVNLVIDGNDKTFRGGFLINGDARLSGSETVTFKKINFESKVDGQVFVQSPQKINGTYSYAHNVTLDECSFANAGKTDVVACNFNEGYNWTISNCYADGIHSVVQVSSVPTGVTLKNVVGTCTEGLVNVKTSCAGGLEVYNTNVSVTGNNGYGVRMDGTEANLTFDGSVISADYPIVLRNCVASDKCYLTFNGNCSLNANNGVEILATAGQWKDGDMDWMKTESVIEISGAKSTWVVKK